MADWLTALRLALGYAGLWLLCGVALWTVVAILRRLPCAFGWHRRETVEETLKAWYPDSCLMWRCLDCGRLRPYASTAIRTPSRRYALRQPKQGRAA